MEITSLSKGYATVEFLSDEVRIHGSLFKAVAERLPEDVQIRIIKPIDYDEKRDMFLVKLRLTRGVVAQR